MDHRLPIDMTGRVSLGAAVRRQIRGLVGRGIAIAGRREGRVPARVSDREALEAAFRKKRQAAAAFYERKMRSRDAAYQRRLQERDSEIGRLGARIGLLESRLAAARDAVAMLTDRAAARAEAQLRRDEANRDKSTRLSAALRTERMTRNDLERVIAAVPRYEHGSVTPGIEEWRDKWADSPGRRIMFYSKMDYSGSLMKWAAAVNAHTPFAARLVALQAHRFGYPTDLVIPVSASIESDLAGLADEADVIHLKDETGFLDGTNGLPGDMFERFDRPIVFTQYGGYARKHRDDREYQRFVSAAAARVAMTPDLMFPWFDGRYIPHSIDTDRFAYSWTDGALVGHSPSTRDRKGTDEFLIAVDRLRQTTDVDLDLIEQVSHEECIARKERSNLFFDQAGREVASRLGTDLVVGWYGNSALEAAVHGIPTIAHLSEEAFDGARRGGRDIADSCAIINTPLGAHGIEETLRWFFSLSGADRADLSRRTRAWIEDFHSDRAVARELERLYRSL